MEDNPDQDVGAQKQHQDELESEEKQSVQGYITIKGTRNGLLLTLEPNTPFSELLRALAERLAVAPTFFRGASLSVDTSRRALRVSERIQLEDLLAHYHMSIAMLEQASNARKSAKTIALSPIDALSSDTTASTSEPFISRRTEFTGDQHNEPFSADHLDEVRAEFTGGPNNNPGQRDMRESADTLFIRRTIRSGQAIYHQSNIVVMGDVNPGAEIVAGGDVIVWGALRGMVHAGYPDNEQALVCSLQLSPVQLRIAHLLSRPPEGFEARPKPEVALIRQGQIAVEAWTNGRMPRR